MSRSPKWSDHYTIPEGNYIIHFLLPVACCMSRASFPYLFGHPDKNLWSVQDLY